MKRMIYFPPTTISGEMKAAFDDCRGLRGLGGGGGEFELPLPICEQSDDSIKLSFATSTRTAESHRPATHFLARLRIVARSDRLLWLS
jgi:hypothetical protein